MSCAWPSPFASAPREHASLRDPTEIIVDGWRPARHDHVETNGLGDPIGMSERARAPVPGLNNNVKTERYAMREQRLVAVAIEGDESVPQSSVSRGNCAADARGRSSTALASAVSFSPGDCCPKAMLFASISRQELEL